MSDHKERACRICGSYLHHENNCPKSQSQPEEIIPSVSPAAREKELEEGFKKLMGILEQVVTRESSECRQTDKNKKEVWENFKSKNGIIWNG